MFIVLYVDDVLMVWKQREILEMVKRRLQEILEMKGLGTSTFLLRIELMRQGGGGLFLVQTKVCFRGAAEV